MGKPNDMSVSEFEDRLRTLSGERDWSRWARTSFPIWIHSEFRSKADPEGQEYSARFLYNHLENYEWMRDLALAVGVPMKHVNNAMTRLYASPGSVNNATECAIFRELIPWDAIEHYLIENSAK